MSSVQISEKDFYKRLSDRTINIPVVIIGLGCYLKSKNMTPEEILTHLDTIFPGNVIITIKLMKEKLEHIEAKCSRCDMKGKFMNKCNCGGYINII
jgi:hypothetical protein